MAVPQVPGVLTLDDVALPEGASQAQAFGMPGILGDIFSVQQDLASIDAFRSQALAKLQGERSAAAVTPVGLTQAEAEFRAADMLYQIFKLRDDFEFQTRMGQALENAGYLTPGSYLPAPSDQTYYDATKRLAVEAYIQGVSPEEWLATRQSMWQQQQAAQAQAAASARASAKAEADFDQVVSKYQSAYFNEWGTFPPPGLAEKAARSMNIFEFIQKQRQNPAWENSHRGQVERISVEASLARLLGSAL